MTVGDTVIRSPYSHQVWKEGSTYKSRDRNGVIEVENSDFLTLFNTLKTTIGTSGDEICLEKGTYQLSDKIPLSGSHNTLNVKGLGNKFRVMFEPLGDFPCFELSDCDYFELWNVGFINNQSTRTAPFVNIKDNCNFGKYFNLYMINNYKTGGTTQTYQGIGVQFECVSTGQTYYNRFFNLDTRNLNQVNKVKSSASSVDGVWVNSNSWLQCYDFNSNQFLKLDQRTGTTSQEGHFDHNVFLDCHIQCHPLSNNIFDLDSGFSNVHIGGGTMIWDQIVASPISVKVSPTTRLQLGINSNVDVYLGGSGYNNGARISRSNVQTELFGMAQFTSDGIQTDFPITHNFGLNNASRVPTKWKVWSASVDGNLALPVRVVDGSVTSTQMTVRFAKPPRAPNPSTVTNNIKIFWEVSLF